MQAAVANMTTQPDGTLLPDPQGGAVGGVEPYPLTYIEYAIAPAQPLTNTDCTPNAAAQAALSQWLNFLVGAGQNDLPAGMVQLPGSLVTQAQAAIAKVGSAAAACTPAAGSITSATAGSGGSTAASSGSSNGAADSFSSSLPAAGDIGFGTGGTSSTATGGSGKSPGSSSKVASGSVALSLSAFETVSPTSWALPLLAVLVLGLLLPGLVLLASGRSLTEALGGLRAGPNSAVTPPSDAELDGGAEP